MKLNSILSSTVAAAVPKVFCIFQLRAQLTNSLRYNTRIPYFTKLCLNSLTVYSRVFANFNRVYK